MVIVEAGFSRPSDIYEPARWYTSQTANAQATAVMTETITKAQTKWR